MSFLAPDADTPEVVVELSPVRPTTDAIDASRLLAEAPLLLAVFRTICPTHADAEDVLGATIEIALRNITTLRDERHLRSWLLRIGIREATRLRRRLSWFVRLDQVDVAENYAEIEPGSVDIGSALRRLPPKMRLAVVLHYMVGLSVAETASSLRTSPNTVKTQLRIGLKRLREGLRDG